MRDRSMRSGTELALENKSNLSNRSSGVQISRDICTLFGRYLYSAKCSWIVNVQITYYFVYLLCAGFIIQKGSFINRTTKENWLVY